jgi:hypothetical protein
MKERIQPIAMEGSRGQPTRSVPPAWVLGVELTAFQCKNISLFQKFIISLGFGRISK